MKTHTPPLHALVARVGTGLALLGAIILSCDTSLADSRSRQVFIQHSIRQDDSQNFVDGGKFYCGPVSAANALVGMAELGMGSLSPLRADPRTARRNLTELLATREYMDTSEEDGTWPGRFMNGVLKHVSAHGYPGSTFELIGFSRLPGRLEATRKSSDVSRSDVLRALNSSSSLVWLHVGWYQFVAEERRYEHKGAHYLHLIDSEGENFIAFNATPKRSHIPYEKFTLRPMGEGSLNMKSGISLPSKGLLSLESEPALREKRIAVLQGVLTLTLRK